MWLLVLLSGFVVLAVFQVLFITLVGEKVLVPDIPKSVSLGKGEPVRFVVIGDSTAVGQGADYKDGIAYGSAQFLAKNRHVEMTNFGVSGAITSEVLSGQVKKAANLKPDVVLVCVGANDVTHLSNLASVEKDMTTIIDTLQKSNPNAKIVLTGSPAMGSVPRFPQPTKFFAGLRTEQMNKVMQKIADQKKVTRVQLAEKTGPIFARNPHLFAADKFHPNKQGYAIWVPVIIKGLQKAT